MSNQFNDKLVFQLSASVDFKSFNLGKDETGVTFKSGQEIKSERSFLCHRFVVCVQLCLSGFTSLVECVWSVCVSG